MMSRLLSSVSDTWFIKPGLGAHFWSHKSQLFDEFVMVEGMTFTVSDLMTSPSHSWDFRRRALEKFSIAKIRTEFKAF